MTRPSDVAFLITLLITGCAAEPPAAQPARPSPISVEEGPKLRPVDQAGSDPSFLAFRMELIGAVRHRDREHLLSVLDENIRVSFGGDEGVEDFKKYWRLDDPSTELWYELVDVLRLGGTFQTLPDGRRRFCAPYVYSAYPENAPDPFESLVVIAKRAELLEEPEIPGRVIALLEYDIVRIAPDDPQRAGQPAEWRKVVTASGKTGWVHERAVRSHIDYRACFEKVDGEWKMTLLVAGD